MQAQLLYSCKNIKAQKHQVMEEEVVGWSCFYIAWIHDPVWIKKEKSAAGRPAGTSRTQERDLLNEL